MGLMVMQQYYFIFILAGIWILAAAICDLRKREVPNWINFSFIVFALVFKGFYSAVNGNWSVFGFGLLGFVVAFALAYAFYYGRVFGGGDAKLLMGIGAILPITSFYGLIAELGGFLIVLAFVGGAYSLLYSFGLTLMNGKKFAVEFGKEWKRFGFALMFLLFIGLLFFGILYFVGWGILGAGLLVIFGFIPFLYVYLRSVDKTCMINLTKPSKLTEGDWLAFPVRCRGKEVRRRADGLSLEEIAILKKQGKSVLIKQGIPFIPAFFFSWIVMVFFYLVLGFGFLGFFASLF